MHRLPTWSKMLILALLLLVAAGFELALGPMNIPVSRLVPAAVLYFHGVRTPDAVVVGAIRLPRLLVAMLVGVGLSLVGAALQAIFRNPMADPGIIGVSSGGSVGAVVSIATGVASHGLWVSPLFAFFAGMLAMFAVYRLGTVGGKTSIYSLLLAGVAISALCGSVVTFLLSIEPTQTMQGMLFWIMGGLDNSSWVTSAMLCVVVGVATLVFSSCAKAFDIMSLGEEQAEGVGVNLQQMKRVTLFTSALTVGVMVSISGVISFVGLIVPHFMRMWVGPAHRVLLPASALGGAILMTGADVVARMALSPTEINIGVITSLLGAPFFLYLLRRQYSTIVRRR